MIGRSAARTNAQRAAAALLAAAALQGACGSAMRVAETGSSALGAQLEVEYPPPPAKVERLPPDPGPPCVWVDGYWDWVGRRWEWAPGAWYEPPPECLYSPPALTWAQTGSGGVLYYKQPRWYKTSPGDGEPARDSRCVDARRCGAVPTQQARTYSEPNPTE
jgi:hypothetical protein